MPCGLYNNILVQKMNKKMMLLECVLIEVNGIMYKPFLCTNTGFWCTEDELDSDNAEIFIDYDKIDFNRDTLYTLTKMNPEDYKDVDNYLA